MNFVTHEFPPPAPPATWPWLIMATYALNIVPLSLVVGAICGLCRGRQTQVADNVLRSWLNSTAAAGENTTWCSTRVEQVI